ncbi:MAG: hypothetical protein MZV65_33655 [Chromatiales bacterium]|nr:hypothetical protein [Chromatiales bacterium]
MPVRLRPRRGHATSTTATPGASGSPIDVVVGTALGLRRLRDGAARLHLQPAASTTRWCGRRCWPACSATRLAGVAVIFDLGRYVERAGTSSGRGYAQLNSVMLEVALCVAAYIVVLWIEFSPAFFENGCEPRTDVCAQRARPSVLFFFIALGMLLPTMHQSSLGTLLLLLGDRSCTRCGRRRWLPLLFLHRPRSCMGFARRGLRGHAGVGRLQAPARDADARRGCRRIMCWRGRRLPGGARRRPRLARRSSAARSCPSFDGAVFLGSRSLRSPAPLVLLSRGRARRARPAVRRRRCC